MLTFPSCQGSETPPGPAAGLPGTAITTSLQPPRDRPCHPPHPSPTPPDLPLNKQGMVLVVNSPSESSSGNCRDKRTRHELEMLQGHIWDGAGKAFPEVQLPHERNIPNTLCIPDSAPALHSPPKAGESPQGLAEHGRDAERGEIELSLIINPTQGHVLSLGPAQAATHSEGSQPQAGDRAALSPLSLWKGRWQPWVQLISQAGNEGD